MLRFLVYVAIAAVLAYAAVTIPLGKRTFVGHVKRIWQTEEVQELKEGVKEKAGPAVDRLERGVRAGYKAATDGSGSAEGSSHGSGDGSGSQAAGARGSQVPGAEAAP